MARKISNLQGSKGDGVRGKENKGRGRKKKTNGNRNGERETSQRTWYGT